MNNDADNWLFPPSGEAYEHYLKQRKIQEELERQYAKERARWGAEHDMKVPSEWTNGQQGIDYATGYNTDHTTIDPGYRESMSVEKRFTLSEWRAQKFARLMQNNGLEGFL